MEAEKKKPTVIAKVEGGKSINDLINETNRVYSRFHDVIKDPLDKKRTDVMKICLFTKTKGAGIRHCYLGSMLAMVASIPDITVEALQKQVKILDDSPFIKIQVVDKWEPTFEALESWVSLYVDKAKATPGMIEEAEELLPRAKNVVANAQSEYHDLDLMAKAKMAKANLNASNEIKKSLQEITNDCKSIATEI